MNVCEKCPLQDPCIIHLPQKTFGGMPLIAHQCAYHTCPEGLAAAHEALGRDDAETITVDGAATSAHLFGTPAKPTYDEEAAVRRYVTDDGQIWATSLDGNAVIFTGLTIESLALVWGPKRKR